MNDANMFLIGTTALLRRAANEIEAKGLCAALAEAFCSSKNPTGQFLYETGQISSDIKKPHQPVIATSTKRRKVRHHQR